MKFGFAIVWWKKEWNAKILNLWGLRVLLFESSVKELW
jgi:hypothetical protein